MGKVSSPLIQFQSKHLTCWGFFFVSIVLTHKEQPLLLIYFILFHLSYRKKLWDDTCVGCNVDPSSVVLSENVNYNEAPERDNTRISGGALAQFNQASFTRLEDDAHADEVTNNLFDCNCPPFPPLSLSP